MKNTVVLELNTLSKTIGKKKIVKDINLTLNSGEIFGLLGPNGAGKTTIMRMITGLIKPTSGAVIINGYNLRLHMNNSLASLGAIIESPDLYKHLSGYRNLKIFSNMSQNVNEK